MTGRDGCIGRRKVGWLYWSPTVEYCVNGCTPYSSNFLSVDNGVFCEIIYMATGNMSKHNHSHPVQGGLVSVHHIFCKGQHQGIFSHKDDSVVLLAVCCKFSILWHRHTSLGCITEFH